MKDIQNLELTVLVDLLSQHTARYYKILSDGGSEEEFTSCKKTIQLLQSEIEFRKKSAKNSTVTDPTSNLSQD
jgi:hypothetical protein